ncbi:MAG: bifunctional methylenetetrahydrofolate dehydrogenase/methenyltetrahydrofolate cyclohydrolase FolD [Magnetococcales bacterium]|nr:bifunctional methylenetetrahydrofolate dehydrogenase/methenyltetrahydrofolate cyclohydrolase FolD [Magnetococcales bacterium]
MHAPPTAVSRIIDGKRIALSIRQELKKEVELLTAKTGMVPGLAVVLVGADPASQVYVRMKKKACEDVGIRSFSHELDADTSQETLLALVEQLNRDDQVHGILVQLPLPEQISEQRVIEAISPAKDVDGFHPYNAGQLMTGGPGFWPCTPWGVMELLKSEGVELAGKQAVVIGRSNIVGKPVALMLLAAHATVTICHSKTPDLASVVRQADIVVAAVGRPRMVQGDWIKPGAVVIDVGTNRLEDGSLCGDVDFEAAKEQASAISPSPGGVGPMTIAMLVKNTVEGAKKST